MIYAPRYALKEEEGHLGEKTYRDIHDIMLEHGKPRGKNRDFYSCGFMTIETQVFQNPFARLFVAKSRLFSVIIPLTRRSQLQVCNLRRKRNKNIMRGILYSMLLLVNIDESAKGKMRKLRLFRKPFTGYENCSKGLLHYWKLWTFISVIPFRRCYDTI